ncbi:MAG: hypothetical protein PHE54_03115 [Bacilli bacterium]|nr:hypothetical protein [Bacilli bacterium]
MIKKSINDEWKSLGVINKDVINYRNFNILPRSTPTLIYSKQPPDKLEFAVISDTHYGSNYTDEDLIEQIGEYCYRNNIDVIMHLGDFIEGDLGTKIDILFRRGKRLSPKRLENFKNKMKLDYYLEQVEYACSHYPACKNTYAISGNHDIIYNKGNYLNALTYISKERKDIIHLGYGFGYLKYNDVNILLAHGDFASLPNKYSKLKVEEKPGYSLLDNSSFTYDFLCLGHVHEHDYYQYHNTHVLQAPGFTNKNYTDAEMGFFHVTINFTSENKIGFVQIDYHELKKANNKIYIHQKITTPK